MDVSLFCNFFGFRKQNLIHRRRCCVSFVIFNCRKCNKFSHVKVCINLCFCTVLSTSLSLAWYIGNSSKQSIVNTKAKCVHYCFVARKQLNAKKVFFLHCNEIMYEQLRLQLTSLVTWTIFCIHPMKRNKKIVEFLLSKKSEVIIFLICNYFNHSYSYFIIYL